MESVAESSQSYVLHVSGVPKNGNAKDAEKWLSKWGVSKEDVSKVKKAHRQVFMKIVAPNEGAMQRIVTKLQGFEFKGKRLDVQRKSDMKRDNEEQEGNKKDSKRVKRDGEEGEGEEGVAVVKDVRDAVSPLWRIPYEEQLEQKTRELRMTLRKMQSKTRRESGKGGQQKQEQPIKWALREDEAGPVVACPPPGHRNKVGFTIGRDHSGAPCIGFRVGRTEHGSTAVGDPTDVAFVSPEAEKVRLAMHEVVVESGKDELHPWDNLAKTGFWRQVEVRTNIAGQSLAVVQVNESGVNPERLAHAKERVLHVLKERVPQLIGLGWQHNSGVSSGGSDAEIKYLFGDGFLEEKIGDVTFRIPPQAFFQTNSLGVVPLYDLAVKLVEQEAARLSAAQAGAPVKVFDVCCGIGTIGLYLRSKLGKGIGEVVGIDIVPEAIAAAEENAKRNNMAEGISFVASPAEKVMDQYLKECKDQNVIAVVDPPRPGLHSNVTRALRNSPIVKSIVYISCNVKSLVIDTVPLCKTSTKRFDAPPFEPVFMSGVDMFPGTDHLEAVVLFRRT